MPIPRLFFLIGLTVSLAACGSTAGTRVSRAAATASRTAATVRTSTTAAATCSISQAPETIRRGSQIATVSAAYRDLLARYVRALQPGPLLDAAWQGATAEAKRDDAAAPDIAAPVVSGDQADADWNTFASSYAKLSDATEGAVDQVQLAFAAVSQMAASLDEGHTYFVPPEAFAQEGKEPHVSGIGVEVTGRTAPFTVTDVVGGGPADRAGVRAGDTITAVNGCTAQSLDAEQLSQLIRGKAGTSVQITFGEPRGGSTTLTITRAEVTFPLFETKLLPGNVGLVRLHSFPSADTKLADGHMATAELSAALASFQAGGASGWILDLRGDPGGEVNGLQAIAGVILPPGPIFSFVDRTGTKQVIRTEGSRVTQPPLRAVLVDGGTASAAEILTSAIQEENVAQVIGDPTAGIANGAELVGLPNGAGLSITHFQTFTVDGSLLNGTGVTPNIAVARDAADAASGADPQLERAEQLAQEG